MRRTRAFALVPAVLTGTLVACSPTVSSEYASTGPVERQFTRGGTVHMDLSAGQYLISGTESDRLRVRWSAENPEDAKQAKVVVDVKDSTARIVTDGPSNNFRVEIEMPARSHIILRLSAGEVRVNGIEGNKDISAWAGEVTVGVPDASQYGKVSASLTAGEIRAEAFDEKREGVFPSFNWQGKGSYELSTRLTAGQINFRDEGSPAEQEEAAPPEEQKPDAPPAEQKEPGGA